MLLLVALLCASMAGQTGAISGKPMLAYQVTLADPAQHLLHISIMGFPPDMETRVQLPVWNALYQVRDFAQYVTSVRASVIRPNATAVVVRQIDKTTWAANGAQRFDYDVFADNPGPFGAQLNSAHAFFNLAEILMYVAPDRDRLPVAVTFCGIPNGWQVATSLRHAQGFADCQTFTARDYDDLVDAPVEMGTFRESEFDDGGAKYRVVVDADPSDYDLAAVTETARKLAAAEVDWMQDRPFDHYLFIYHFPRRPAGGGMEHAYSTAIDASAERVRNDPQSLAGVTAHEFFHLWNVKRIRPQSLEPVDYTKEQYTRALWFSEGATSTVADTMRVRAGLLDEQQYLTELAASITRLESRPARLAQSLEESSLDTWLDKYSYYTQPERSISYYNKGEIVGVLLDLALREASGGKASLRDLFHWMDQHYARQGRFFPDSAGVEEAAEAVSGADFHDFFAKYVAGIEPLPYDRFFAGVGLRLEKHRQTIPALGFEMRNPAEPMIVTAVEGGSEAERAGVQVGDIVQEFNGKPLGGRVDRLLASLNPGETLHLKLAGAGGTHEVKFKLGAREQDEYVFADVADVTAAQRARRAAWLRGDSQP